MNTPRASRHPRLRLTASVLALALFSLTGSSLAFAATPAQSESIRPFKVHVPQADLDDLRQRVLATRWPDKETVNDESQGVQLAKVKGLVEYWGKH